MSVTPRQLYCYDEVPSTDGTCTNRAWVEVPPPAIQPITIEQAEQVGGAFFVGLVTLGVIKGLLNPKKDDL